jgi:hypothetical protein
VEFSAYSQSDLLRPSARLLLLTKFQRPNAVEEFTRYDDWKQALQQPVEKVVASLVQDGLLREGTLADRLAYSFKVSELKEMLRSRELPVSGKKEVLTARLVENCADSMRELVRHCSVMVCSPPGQELAEVYINAQREMRLQVESATRLLVQKREFRLASEAMAEFEAQQVFARGWNVDWTNYDTSADVVVLHKLFEHVPAVFAGVSAEELEQLRLAAALYYLWGTPARPFPPGFSVAHRIPAEQLAQMLWYGAKFQVELAELRDRGTVKWVRITGCNDDLVCPACTKLQQKRHRIDHVPELPYAHCTSENGCRCDMVPDLD